MPIIVGLAQSSAAVAAAAGAKAANLAVARRAALPVLDGFVLTERLCTAIEAAGSSRALDAVATATLARAWSDTGGDTRRLVVRSSSRAEDGAASSLAGRFRSVLDVVGWDAFLDAIDTVVESARLVVLDDVSSEHAPMAVLVQPQLDARCGGVLFGVDPVSGRDDHVVVAAVSGGPDRLVSGIATGATYTLGRRGRLLSVDRSADDPRLDRGLRRRLARLARDVHTVFGTAQDVEWAVDEHGRLWLLQSRPVTSAAAPVGHGRVLGPGPVAESFPDQLSVLEQDLWLRPLNDGLTEAMLLVGATSRRRLRALPPVIAVHGRAAVDLDLIGASPVRRSLWRTFDPIPPARRLRAAWRTGRLRHALPALAADLVDGIDAELSSVRAPAALPFHQLLAVLRGSYRGLVAVHGHEVLIGLLTASDGVEARASAADGLLTLAAQREAGHADSDIVVAHPIVLALTAPKVGPPGALPPTDLVVGDGHPPATVDVLARLREDLRLRARWLQELTALVAWELGARLVAMGVLPDPDAVRWLTVAELEAVVAGDLDAAVIPVDGRRRRPSSPPLPFAFRLSRDGSPVGIAVGGDEKGQGAGGGRGIGTVWAGPGVPPAGTVLVVRTLDPALASVLPHLGGLVAETGSVLSHLAILAREFGVPTVVALPGAVERFVPGTTLLVDGAVGEVSVVGADAAERELDGPRAS